MALARDIGEPLALDDHRAGDGRSTGTDHGLTALELYVKLEDLQSDDCPKGATGTKRRDGSWLRVIHDLRKSSDDDSGH
jgi:hypothetical protein